MYNTILFVKATRVFSRVCGKTDVRTTSLEEGKDNIYSMDKLR